MNKFKGSPRRDILRGLPTGIGSLPYTNKDFACQKILQYFPQVPHWPQLPKLNFCENMYVQFSEGFPGIIIEEKNQRIYLDSALFQEGLEKFYENFLNKNLDFFQISEKYASGFHHFCRFLSSHTNSPIHQLTNSLSPLAVKGQITGPLTMGLAIKDENDRSIFYDEQIRDALVKFLQMKALWQISQLSTINYQLSTILFIDEPYLAAYGSAYTAVSREEIISSLQEVISGIKNFFVTNSPIHQSANPLLLGVHCCANTDWSIVLETGIDVLSFDAYNFFDSLILYRDKLKDFLERGGILSWGIVPTDEKVFEETSERLKNKFLDFVDQLVKTGISEKKLFTNFLITPSCGLGTKSEKITENALTLTSELSKILQEAV